MNSHLGQKGNHVTSEMLQFKMVDVEARSQTGTPKHEIPSRVERRNVEAGDLIKVEWAAETPKGRACYRGWVRVTEPGGKTHRGILLQDDPNIPVELKNVSQVEVPLESIMAIDDQEKWE